MAYIPYAVDVLMQGASCWTAGAGVAASSMTTMIMEATLEAGFSMEAEAAAAQLHPALLLQQVALPVYFLTGKSFSCVLYLTITTVP